MGINIELRKKLTGPINLSNQNSFFLHKLTQVYIMALN